MYSSLCRVSAAMLVFCAAGLAAAIDNPEVEPNNGKPAATLCASGGIGMDAGDTITGTTTGTVSTAGATSSDFFLVKTKARPLGIYKYRLSFTSATAGHTITLRGLSQAAGVINPASDASIQSHSTTLVSGARTVQWYGFGRQEQIYVKVTGTAATTAPYVGTLSVEAVTPTTVSGSVVDGTVTIKEDPSSTADTDFMVYDASYNPISGFMHDNTDATGLVRDYVAGTYNVVWGTFNTCNNQPSPSDDTNQTGSVTDFPNVIVNTSVTSVANHSMLIQTDAGDASVTLDRTSAFDVNFVRMNMVVNTIPLPPTCSATIDATTILNDGTGAYNVTVDIAPGRRPASVNHICTIDLGPLGDNRPQPVTMTQVSPTQYTIGGVVADGTAPGPYQITVSVQETSPSNRSSVCTVNTTLISPPTGACCTNDGCSTLTERDCIAQGGVYQGNGVACGGCTCASTEPPVNADCAAAVMLDVGSQVLGNTCAAPTQFGPTCGGVPVNAAGLWYKFRGTGNTMTLDTCSSPTSTDFNTRLSVYCGTDCNNLTCVGGNDNGACGNNQSSLTVCTQANADYLVLVHNNGAAGGDFVLSLSDLGTSCDPTVRCIPTGGCCLADGCQDVTEADCTTLGGTFLGLGTPCITRTQNPGTASTDVPVAIPDSNNGVPGVAEATITVGPGTGTINYLVVAVGITHTYVGDLIGSLSNGTNTVTLFTREGGAPNLAGTYVFTDTSTTRLGGTGLILTADVIPADNYMPATPMADLNGVPYEGTWTFRITDNAGIDIGTIDSFVFVDVTETNNCGGGCSPCAADYNVDGGVDGSDIASFFPDWEASASCADVNLDGGVDGADIEAFFVVWQNGGC